MTNLSNILNATHEELIEAHMDGTLYDYVNEALEVEYTMNLSGELRGVKILVVFGGPNVYINTRTAKIEGYDNGEHLEINLDFDVLREIEDIIIGLI